MRGSIPASSERGLEADAVLGDDQILRQVAAPRPVQPVIDMALHEILMDHDRKVEGESMAAVHISYARVEI